MVKVKYAECQEMSASMGCIEGLKLEGDVHSATCRKP